MNDFAGYLFRCGPRKKAEQSNRVPFEINLVVVISTHLGNAGPKRGSKLESDIVASVSGVPVCRT